MYHKEHISSSCFLSGSNEFYRNTILSGEYFLQNTAKTFSSRNILFVGTDVNKIAESAIKPNILQANGSYVILDERADKLKSLGLMLEKEGYELRILDFFSKENTHTYNPFLHIKHTRDVQTLIHTILGACRRPFGALHNILDPLYSQGHQTCVENAAEHLLRACVYYLLNECNQADQNLHNLKMLIESALESANTEQGTNNTILAHLFSTTMVDYPSAFPAHREYTQFRSQCFETRKDAILLLLAAFQGLEELYSERVVLAEEISISDLQEKKIAVFLLAGEKPPVFQKLQYSLFFAQLFDTLSEPDLETANLQSVPVKLILDDSSYIRRIPNFSQKLSEFKERKRNVAVFLSLDSIRTLTDIYGKNSDSILKHMDVQLYFPCMDDDTRTYAISLIKPHCDTFLGRFVKNLRNGIIYHAPRETSRSTDTLLFYRKTFVDKVSAYPYTQHPRYCETADYNPKLCYQNQVIKPDTLQTVSSQEGGELA